MKLITPPPVYFATRRSSHHPMQQPSFRVVAVRHLDEPLTWATQDHAETIHSDAIQASQPKRLIATASVTSAPYARSLKITVEFDDSPVFPVELTIIAASEDPAEVQTAMQDDVSRFVHQAEERGWMVRQAWSDYRGGVYCSPKCHAEVVVQHSGKATWWDSWTQPVPVQVAVTAARGGLRIPIAEEEKAKLILGEEMLDLTKYEEKGMVMARLSWADMGLVRAEGMRNE